jgi:hypothetical protein
MVELKTPPEVLEALHRSATTYLSSRELHDQRVSFIMGMLKESSNITRARVEEVIADRDGQSKT